MLNEVRFAPAAGEVAFVEVSNISSSPIDLGGATLRVGGSDILLPDALSLPAGAQLLVLFDGRNSVEGTVVHAGTGLHLPEDHGAVELLDGAGVRLDRVAWGDAEPAAVASGPGGMITPGFEAGTSIGRPPGANDPGAPEDWVVYVAVEVSPGETNPMPAVSVTLPLSGAVLDGSTADLLWYPVPGATSYRVQVASEPAFATPVLDATATEPRVNVARLAPGDYLWRVQAMAADGTASGFSEPANFELAAGAAATLASAQVSRPGVHGAGTLADTPGAHLTVPVLAQHKDTGMLLLERNVETGAHAWDKDHGTLDASDPADNKNCAIAMVAMISAFYLGNLSQDRIGYEVLQRRGGNPAGPEGDLIYGHGIAGLEASEAFRFALGGVTEGGLMTFDDMWNTIVKEIGAGRPVPGANSHHGFVVTGYEVTGGHRLISINDPWPGRTYKVDIDRSQIPASDFNLWLLPAKPAVRHQEASVTTDTDGDGVVDFDETERFTTNPSDRDSDGDDLPDKQDIIIGVFDPTYGYAAHRSQFGRDFDDDGNPTERDKDSDDGGCPDGMEDKSRNGHREPPETWNFNGDDDSCNGWSGSMTVTRKWTYSAGMETGSATTTFNGVWVHDENPQHYDFACQGDNPPPDCAQIFLPTGTISWSFTAQCGDRSDSGSGMFEAATGYVVPEFDWAQQAIYLRRTPDGKKLQYWGLGVMVGVTDQGEPYCPAGEGGADAERYFFEILEDAVDREPYPGTIQSCFGRRWEIGVGDGTIAGTCETRSVEGETDSVFVWNLVRVGDPSVD